MLSSKQSVTTPVLIAKRIAQAPASTVWAPRDFFDLGSKDVVEKALQRMVSSKQLRRVSRGLYDQPTVNILTGQPSAPDYSKVIDAIHRCKNIRILIDGIVAANDLGLTNAVPGKVVIHSDARLRSIRLNNLVIRFKLAAPSKLYWADRPAMRIVQALYWFRDSLKQGDLIDEATIQNKLIRLLQNKNQGAAILDDLVTGLHTLPAWMQDWVKNLLVKVKKAPKDKNEY
jgi:hypothetical protein